MSEEAAPAAAFFIAGGMGRMTELETGMTQSYLGLAAAFGLSAVAMGAFGAHGLQGLVGADGLAPWRTAVDYQMFHALVLLALAAQPAITDSSAGRFAGRAFTVGILLFSGSLYLLVLSRQPWLGAIAPAGGLCLMAGWGALGLHAWRNRRGSRP